MSLARQILGAAAIAMVTGSADLAAASEFRILSVSSPLGSGDDATLRYSKSDADRVLRVFEELTPGRAKGRALHSPRTSDIVEQLKRWSTSSPFDVLVFYYSGHADAAGLRLGREHLPYAALRARLRDLPARVRLVVIDACQSGGALRAKGAVPLRDLSELSTEVSVEGEVIIASSASTEDSLESDELGASVFTHSFLIGLRGAADGDADARVTLEEAIAYARRATLRSTLTGLVLQRPMFAIQLRGEQSLVLSSLDVRAPTFTLEIDVPGTLRLRSAHRGWVTTIEEAGARRLVLTEGRYVAWQHDRGRGVVRELDGRRGQTVRLSRVRGRTRWIGTKGRIKGSHAGPRVSAAGGVRGGTITGFGPGPTVTVDLRFDAGSFAWGPTASWFRSSADGERWSGTDDTYALGGAAEYLWHGPWLSWVVGLDLQAVLHHQRTTEGVTAAVTQETGLYLGADIQLSGPWSIRMTAGPRVEVLEEEGRGVIPVVTGFGRLGVQAAL